MWGTWVQFGGYSRGVFDTPTGTPFSLIVFFTPDPIWGMFIPQALRDLWGSKSQESIALPCSL